MTKMTEITSSSESVPQTLNHGIDLSNERRPKCLRCSLGCNRIDVSRRWTDLDKTSLAGMGFKIRELF